MSAQVSNRQLRGIITPLLTPFSEEGSVDFRAMEGLVNHVIDGGINGLFVLGTTGEGPCLSLVDREEIVRRAIRFSSGRVPVLVGITDIIYDSSVRMARIAEESGADAVVITPPPYFSSYQAEILDYFESLSSVSNLPWYLYNIPSLTKTVIAPETVVQAGKLRGIAGIKDSSGDMVYFNKVRQAVQDIDGFSMYIGPEELLTEAVRLGVQGGVHGGSNLFPHLYSALFKAAERNDTVRVQELQSVVLKISSQLYSLSKYENHCIRVLKYLLSLFGLCGDNMVKPYQGLSDESKQLARDRLEPILLELTKAGIPTPSLLLTPRSDS
jgi:dihydrodipicolinate synthase/N-acetylneuraminate lyase